MFELAEVANRMTFQAMFSGEGRNAGDALNGYCRRIGADLLVMGAYGHARFREFVLGGATRTVLADPALPVLLTH